MSDCIIKEKVINEINLIPESKLPEILDFIHYFRIGLEKSKESNENAIFKGIHIKEFINKTNLCLIGGNAITETEDLYND